MAGGRGLRAARPCLRPHTSRPARHRLSCDQLGEFPHFPQFPLAVSSGVVDCTPWVRQQNGGQFPEQSHCRGFPPVSAGLRPVSAAPGGANRPPQRTSRMIDIVDEIRRTGWGQEVSALSALSAARFPVPPRGALKAHRVAVHEWCSFLAGKSYRRDISKSQVYLVMINRSARHASGSSPPRRHIHMRLRGRGSAGGEGVSIEMCERDRPGGGEEHEREGTVISG